MHKFNKDFGVWTPILHVSPNLTFRVNLNPDFGRYAACLRPTEESIRDMLFGRIRERYPNQLKMTPSNMYHLGGDSAFLIGIYLNGGNGLWLTADDVFTNDYVPTDERAVRYSPHNLDYIQDAVMFQLLFQHWVEWIRYGGHAEVEGN